MCLITSITFSNTNLLATYSQSRIVAGTRSGVGSIYKEVGEPVPEWCAKICTNRRKPTTQECSMHPPAQGQT